MADVKNSEVIDRPNYYDLPCGRQVEDYIFAKGLKFWLGCALKYLRRAGLKHGETADKDERKAEHYVEYGSSRDRQGRSVPFWNGVLYGLMDEMMNWDGDDKSLGPLPEDLR